MSKGKIFWGVMALALVGIGSWYFTRTPEPTFEVEKVGRSTVAQTVSVTGELKPVEYADISFRQVGRVTEVLVKEGDSVKAGQVMVKTDDSTLRSQLHEARIALSIAEENEKLARRGWDNLKPEAREAKKLATEQARENVRTADSRLSEAMLFAPFDGTISRLDVRVGETVSIGETIARVVKGVDMVLESRVPEADIAELSIGMGATVTFDALTNDEVFPAIVSKIQPSATVISDVVSYITTFRLASLDSRLREGMSSTIDIETAKAEDVLVVPFRAVIREGMKSFVEIPRADFTLEKREVVTGLEGDEGMVEVKSGLREGDEVVVSKKK